ncbi:Uncharacterised protein [uncultured archaeon]|nr:Uncharacterised protein [uncultured archaeon]
MQSLNKYIPGTCNIGKEEIRKRRQSGWTGLIITIIIYVFLAYAGAPPIWRLVVFVPATLAAVGFLQAYMHFCAYFGSVGVFNFGEVGKTDTVEQAEFRKIDRKKAIEIVASSILIGAAVAIAAYFLPV